MQCVRSKGESELSNGKISKGERGPSLFGNTEGLKEGIPRGATVVVEGNGELEATTGCG